MEYLILDCCCRFYLNVLDGTKFQNVRNNMHLTHVKKALTKSKFRHVKNFSSFEPEKNYFYILHILRKHQPEKNQQNYYNNVPQSHFLYNQIFQITFLHFIIKN